MFIRIFLLFFFYFQFLHANVILTDDKNKYNDFSLSYLYDESATLNIEDIAKSQFTQKISNQFTLGYTNENIWFKIELKNNSKESDFVLYFTEVLWEKFDLYKKTSDGWVRQEAGLLTPLEKREIEDAHPAFEINLLENESKVFYINGKSVSGDIGSFEIYTKKEFFRPSRMDITTFYEFFFGVLFIIIVINIFLLVEMKEIIYAYYICYVSGFIVFISMHSGTYLYLGFSGWNHGLHTVGAAFIGFLAVFSAEFLEIKKYFPKFNKVFNIFPIGFFIFTIFMNLGLPYFTLVFNIFAFTFFMVLLSVAIKIWLLKKGSIKYYLVALMVYLPGMGMMALNFNTVFPNNDLTRYAFLPGAFIEIIFFSFILTNRFHMSKFEKIGLQQALLNAKTKNEVFLKEEIKKQSDEIAQHGIMMVQQSRMAQMGEMISMIAHQWRQPLASVSAISIDLKLQSQLKEFDLDKKEEAQRYESNVNDGLKAIDDLINNLTTTIDDFRNFYKPNKKLVTTTLEEVALKALNIIRGSLLNENIEIIENYNSKNYVEIYDSEMLQVLLNILKNAQDNFENKKINKPYIKIVTEENKISICDNGGGVPENIIEKIFDPYFSSKSEKNGTGLGLYMSKTIIEEHHDGKLYVENKENGASFVIEL